MWSPFNDALFAVAPCSLSSLLHPPHLLQPTAFLVPSSKAHEVYGLCVCVCVCVLVGGRMCSSTLAGVPSATLRSSLEGSRLLDLWRVCEGHIHALVAVFCGLLDKYSPLSFEVTIITIVFGCIAIRRIARWYSVNALPKQAYVYWKLHDLLKLPHLGEYEPANHLCTALLLYIKLKLWQDTPLTAAELRNKTFMINLLSLYCKPTDGEIYGDFLTPAYVYRKKLMVPVKLPMYPFWTSTRQDGVEVCAWISMPCSTKRSSEARRSVFLRVRKEDSPDGGAVADAALRRFVEDALSFYFTNGYADRDHYDLRMYCPTVRELYVMVKSVALPLGPTLDTLFFPQREHVKSLLERFTEKRGRYTIDGFPHKLGFLLYGPRGTGKRSFVRALAYHTHRHIVRIPLSSFTRRDQLFKMFYFESVLSSSTEEWLLLDNSKVIFLIEGVNGNDDLVRNRTDEHVVHVRRSRGLTTRSSQQANTDRGDAEELGAAKSASQAFSVAARAQEAGKVVTRTIKRPPLRTRALNTIGSRTSPWCNEDSEDSLTLSSLLNILDGVVDDSDRIVVMIADHPECLDPALLRPGRLTTHLRFDYIELDDLIRLCGLFFGSEYCESPDTLRATVEMTKQKQTISFMYERMETSVSTPAQKVHDAFQKMNESCSAQVHPCVACTSKDTEDDRCRSEWVHQGLPASAADADVKKNVIRQLSLEQASQVRSYIAALEEEAFSKASQAGQRITYNFWIAPSHVHHLCMRAVDLNDFLDALSAYIRNESCRETSIKGR
ncbi:A44l protein-like protein [Leishmania tarentolae]|uniref:A44l protein-like protein n=1 Tax=Leishmania tarentolae TaxID=5689 RepID=A0A640KX07_LEITA|nr:A44l protein-like protein [Leishmania tarentolae]